LEGYGKVMGRKGLSFKERELCIVAVLAVLRFEDQLYSHINGAFRAKVTIIKINDVIKNLDLLGKKNLSAFGLRVLKRFKAEKGM
ncbi:MAG: carboxymuconolactone decarboxylase family protein, partial [Chlorobiota bacterium]